jgi:hypothetical protein
MSPSTQPVVAALETWDVPIIGKWERYRVSIEGTSPLLMNRVTQEAIESMQQTLREKRGQGKRRLTPPEKAAMSRYLAPDGKTLVVPKENIQAMIRLAANWFKIGKASLRPIILSVVRMEEPYLDLGTSEYSVDIRPVQIGGKRIPTGRALVWPWKGTFHLKVDAEAISGTVKVSKGVELPAIAALLEYGVSRIGLCDYRPEHGGTFGLGHIAKIDKLEG